MLDYTLKTILSITPTYYNIIYLPNIYYIYSILQCSKFKGDYGDSLFKYRN